MNYEIKNVNIEFDWVRHGFSCANIVKESGTILEKTKINSFISQDAVLTEVGVEQAKDLNKYFLDNLRDRYDIICCSHLRRAVETALYAFNDPDKRKTLYIIPYISEKRSTLGLDYENQSLGLDNLEKYWKKIKDQFNMDLDFSIIKKIQEKNNDIDKESYDDFIKYSVPELVKVMYRKKKSENNKDNKNYNVAVVSHNHFITQHLNSSNVTGGKITNLNNTEIWREKLSLDFEIMLYTVASRNIKPKDCKPDTEACQIYGGKEAPCGEQSTLRCIEAQESVVYKNLVSNPILLPCKDHDSDHKNSTQKQKGGHDKNYYNKYKKYKTKYIDLSKKIKK